MKLILLTIFFTFVFGKYFCDPNGTNIVNLQKNELAFFVKERSFSSCQMEFKLNSTNPHEKIRCYAAVRQAYQANYNPATLCFSTNSTFTVSTIGNSNTFFEGFIIFDEWENISCVLEVISPYNFIDETQVLYLNNTLNSTHTTTSPCKWQFTSPPGYGFKIVVQDIEFNKFTQFYVKNRTDLLINKNSAKIDHAVYNDDTYIEISVSNASPHLKFQVYVTIVKNTINKKDARCIYNDQSKIWMHVDNVTNDETCIHELIVNNNTEVHVNIQHYTVGDTAGDYIGYYDEDGSLVKINVLNDGSYIVPNKYTTFTPFKNGTSKNITWEYVSDGSIPGLGFIVEFEVIECVCSPSLILCDTHFPTYVVNQSYAYCSYMECHFIFEPCDSDFTVLELQFKYGVPTINNDLFQVFSNDVLLFEMQYSNIKQSIHLIHMNSSNENILTVITYYSDDARSATFKTFPFNQTTTSAQAMLTSDNPSYILDTTAYPFIFVEISEEFAVYNYVVQIHRQYDANILLYTDESLTHRLNESCTKSLEVIDFYTCTVQNYKSFIIVGRPKEMDTFANYPYAVVQALNSTKNCIFDKTILSQPVHRKPGVEHETTDISDDFIISALANSHQPCLITFLVELYTYSIPMIKEVWTTSKYENVKVFAGFYQNLSLFEYNSFSQNKWKNIILTSPVYTVEIPVNASIYILVSSTPIVPAGDPCYSNVNLLEYPTYSVATTPCFGISKTYCIKSYFSGCYQRYIIGKML